MKKKNGTREQVGKNIRDIRKSKKMTIAKLAGLIGITGGYLGLMENGKRGISAKVIQDLSDVLQVPVDSFFCYDENEREPDSPMDVLKNTIMYAIDDFNEEELEFLEDMILALKKIRK